MAGPAGPRIFTRTGTKLSKAKAGGQHHCAQNYSTPAHVRSRISAAVPANARSDTMKNLRTMADSGGNKNEVETAGPHPVLESALRQDAPQSRKTWQV